MMKYYIPLETNMMDNDAVCSLINKYGMRGYGMYMAIIVELRKHNNYSCGVDTLRMLARKCKVKFAFLLSVITDFGLFDVEETEDDKIQISSEYVNRVMLPYDTKVRKCKESDVPEVKEHPETQKAENDSNPIAIEEKRIEKNTASEELHSSSAEDTVAAADALEFSFRHKPDDEVCLWMVGAVAEVQSGFVRHLKPMGKGLSPPGEYTSWGRKECTGKCTGNGNPYGYSGLKAQVNSAPGIAWGDNVPQQAAPCKGRLRDSQTESLLTWAFSPQSVFGVYTPQAMPGAELTWAFSPKTNKDSAQNK